jgi:hypothetical protein
MLLAAYNNACQHMPRSRFLYALIQIRREKVYVEINNNKK